MLVVDAANVVGSRPNGWWRDRAKAAADLCSALAEGITSGQITPPVFVVLEGAARSGVEEGASGGLCVVHARQDGDSAIVDVVTAAASEGQSVTVVTADRELRERVTSVGCEVVGPSWLLGRL